MTQAKQTLHQAELSAQAQREQEALSAEARRKEIKLKQEIALLSLDTMLSRLEALTIQNSQGENGLKGLLERQLAIRIKKMERSERFALLKELEPMAYSPAVHNPVSEAFQTLTPAELREEAERARRDEEKAAEFRRLCHRFWGG